MKNLELLAFTLLSFFSILTTHAIGSTNNNVFATQRFLDLQEAYADTSLPKKAEASANNTLKAKKRGNLILLEWQDESETPVTVFEIERSSDGTNFKKIGESASKNESSGLRYEFIDQQPLQVNYYRIKIINGNGEHNYSKEIVFSQNGELYSAVQPNPFIQSFTVEVYLPSPQAIKIQLLDMSGRLLRYKSLSGIIGTNKIEFDDVGSLQKGIYMVRIVRSHAIIEKKIVKNN